MSSYRINGRAITLRLFLIIRCRILAALAASLGPTGVFAHHSFAAEFDYDLTGTIDGEIIEVLFVNPHARYFVAVTDAAGSELIWDAQTSSSNALIRYGWTADTLVIGQRVRMQGNLGRNDTRKLWIREVETETGRIIRPVAGGADADGERE
jgi:hypothetical protein